VHIPLSFDEATTVHAASTGELPDATLVAELLDEVHELFRSNDEGAVADYIPVLAEVDPSLFGLSMFGVRGRSFSVGDSDHRFSIQSISKPFVFALISDH
jgi:glutaminase